MLGVSRPPQLAESMRAHTPVRMEEVCVCVTATSALASITEKDCPTSGSLFMMCIRVFRNVL